jgi:hypothetical protein
VPCDNHVSGAAITAFYMMMGAYDMVIVIDAPNDDAFAALAGAPVPDAYERRTGISLGATRIGL